MSEAMMYTLQVGGALKKRNIKSVLKVIKSATKILDGPETELKNSTNGIYWRFTMTDIPDLTVLQQNKLSYILYQESSYDYNATITYWYHPMPRPIIVESNNDSNVVISIDRIKPLIGLLLDMIKYGAKDALPLHIADSPVLDIVETCFKNSDKINEVLKEEIDFLLPNIPEVPELIII